jgi:hypothetical protein
MSIANNGSMALIIPVVPEGVKLKLARADLQVKSIIAAVEQYAATNASPALLAGDLDGLVFTLRMPPMPKLEKSISVDIGECLYNMRSALDQTTFAMLQANIPNLPELDAKQREDLERASQFPIADSPQQFNGRAARSQMRGLSADAITTIERFQPYFGGKDPVGDSLWCLRELSNTDKHRLVHPTYSVLAEAHVEMHTFPLALPHRDEWNYGVLGPEGVVVTVVFDYPPAEAHVRTHGGVGIALISGSTVLGSIQPVLQNIYSRTKEAVDAMALHCNAV